MRAFAIHLYGADAHPLPVSFETAEAELAALERLYFEPDGAFLWVGKQPGAWQIDGMLYDAAGSLQYVDLRGHCPLPQWRRLVLALVPSGSSLAVVRLSDGALQNLQQFEAEVWGDTAGG